MGILKSKQVASKCNCSHSFKSKYSHCCQHDCFQHIKDSIKMVDTLHLPGPYFFGTNHEKALLLILQQHHIEYVMSTIISYLPNVGQQNKIIGDYHCYHHYNISSLKRKGKPPCKTWLSSLKNNEIKVVMMGSGGVGKSSTTIRFMINEFMDEYDPTIEDTYRKRIALNDNKSGIDCEYVMFDILDTAGREEFSSMQDQYIREGQFFIIIFAVNRRSSFDEAIIYRERLLRTNDDRTDWGYMLVGNKVDLRYDNVYNDKYFVSSEEGLQLAEEWNVPYVEISAKLGKNINFLYRQSAYELWIQSQHPDFAQSPTKAPTLYSPIDKTDSKDIFSLTHLILIFLGISLCICIILMIAIRYIRRLMQRKEMVIEKAMVILIAIGVYDDESDDPDPILRNCDLADLDVENDITNLREVFGCQGFKYTIFPQKTDFEIEWKKQDIIELLNEKAKQFHVESNDYDSLIVAISGHGYDNNICTSDYKLINKVEIEHIFTNEYLESINKPRLFLFDCCDGAKQRENWSDSEESEDTDNQNKNVSNPQQKREKQKKQETKIGKTTALIQEENEEKYNGKLLVSSSNSFKKDLCQNQVEIHAANKGYQAKLDMVTGSYMIYNFCKKLTEDLEIMGQGTKGKKSRYIYEIFDQISDELEIAGKQKIVPTYNNETRYIRFKINTPTELVSDEIEMAETMIKSDSEVSEQ
eukprot:169629_1